MNTGALDNDWEIVSRGSKTLETSKWVGVRTASIKLSSGICKEARIKERGICYAMVQKSENLRALKITLLLQKDVEKLRIQDPLLDGVYTLNADGGGHIRKSKYSGAVLQISSFIQNTPWLRVIARQNKAQAKRFIPVVSDNNLVITVHFVPTFTTESAPDFLDIPASVKGVYCYVDEKGKPLYIGQGCIRSRFDRHKVEKDIPAAKFLWAAIPQEEMRIAAEDHHLNAHFRQYGGLPTYNITPARKHKKRSVAKNVKKRAPTRG